MDACGGNPSFEASGPDNKCVRKSPRPDLSLTCHRRAAKMPRFLLPNGLGLNNPCPTLLRHKRATEGWSCRLLQQRRAPPTQLGAVQSTLVHANAKSALISEVQNTCRYVCKLSDLLEEGTCFEYTQNLSIVLSYQSQPFVPMKLLRAHTKGIEVSFFAFIRRCIRL